MCFLLYQAGAVSVLGLPSPQGTWEQAQPKLPDSTQPRHLKENTAWRIEATVHSQGLMPEHRKSLAEAMGEGG